jgi:CTP synthase (UTP-ammonia lyase)
LIGEFDPAFPPHQATIAACGQSATALREHVAPEWISTRDLTVDALRDFSALWIAPGSPFQSSEAEGEIRVVERRNHPFYIGTLFVPQLRSRLGRPHPLINAFVRAAVRPLIATSSFTQGS